MEYDQCQNCYGYCCNAYDVTMLKEGEVARIAEYLDIAEDEFRWKYIWKYGKDAIKKANPCPFWTMGRCGIHEVKPLACAVYEPKDTQEHCKQFHLLMWKTYGRVSTV